MLLNRVHRAVRRRAVIWTSPKVWQDRMGRTGSFQGVSAHLNATTDWMVQAITATNNQGVAAHYSMGLGWGTGYPETTGYIIPTLLALSDRLGRTDLQEKALALADWLLTTQKLSGGFPGGELHLNLEEVVFNTGQIIRGLVSAWQRSDKKSYLDAALKGGEWLCSVQSEDGAWRKYTSSLTSTREHSYDILTAFGLYRLGKQVNNPQFCEAAFSNYLWTLSQQKRNGFFANAGFEENKPTLTHSLAYVAEGLLRFSKDSGDSRGIDAVHKLLASLEAMYGEKPQIPGLLDESLSAQSTWSCVTGNIQFGWVALRMATDVGDRKLKRWGTALIERGASTQALQNSNPGIRGGVFGSAPIYGKYFPYTTLNWSAKYLLDGLLEL